jgi:hypothetical protein
MTTSTTAMTIEERLHVAQDILAEPDLYAVLGVTKTAPSTDIRRAYINVGCFIFLVIGV